MTSQNFSASKVPLGLGSGARLAGYLLEEQIGEGGMAVVFRAYEERLGRTVALKVLTPALASDPGFRERFVRESRAAAAVDDPHIIPIFEAGEADGVLFIAMRFVRGGDVRSLVARLGVLPAERAMSIISQAASALDAAHRRGLVHRDVKPANMLLDGTADPDHDHLYLSDFGLSKAAMHSTGLTGTGMFLGTVDYVSPEQIEGKPVDGRADQYSLACAGYEMLSGSPPFRREDAVALMWAQMHLSPTPLTGLRPDLPAAVDDVFARALAKSADDRYDSCSRFAEAVRNALGANAAGPPTIESAGSPPGAIRLPIRPPTDIVSLGSAPAGGPPKSSRRAPAVLIAACILAAAGLVSGAILLRSHGHPAAASSGSSSSSRSTPATSPTSPHASSTGTQPSVQARSSSPIAVPPSAGYHLAARLNPGPSTVSVTGVALSSALVAASDKNGNTYLWNVATGAAYGPVLSGPPASPAAYYTAFSPDGSVLATGFQDGSTYLWSAATGKLLARLHDPGRSNGEEVNALAFSPDGRTLATADGNGNTTLWNITGTQVSRGVSLADPAGTGVYSVAFSSNGVLATGDYYGHVYLWDSGTVTATFSIPGGTCNVQTTICGAVSGLAFNGDGAVLAAASINGNAELWSVSGKHEAAMATATQGNPAIWGMAFGGDRTLAIACADGRINIWRVNPGSLTATMAGSLTDPRSGGDGIGAVTISANGRYLVAGDTNGSAYAWKLAGAGAPQARTSARLG
jgi:serine/threonine protein kinase